MEILQAFLRQPPLVIVGALLFIGGVSAFILTIIYARFRR